MAQQSKHFPFSSNYNFHKSDLIHKGIFSHHYPELDGSIIPPVSGNFLLSDNTAFLLSDGTNFLLS